MNSFIVLLATVATCWAAPEYHFYPAPLGHDGRVVETPEVAHLAAAHLAQQAKEAARNGYGHGGSYAPEVSYGGGHEEHHHVPVVHHYHGPPAPLGKDGRVVDTHEVAHAKAAHLHAVAEAVAKAPHGHDYEEHVEYHYSPTYSHGHHHPAPLGHDGNVVDTAEVAHAKEAHYAAYHAAAAPVHH